MKTLLVFIALFNLGLTQEVREPFQAPGKCQQEPDPGDCGEYHVRWFYNPKANRCLRFLYRGCKGNENRFESEEECMIVCKQEPGNDMHDEVSSGDDSVVVDVLGAEGETGSDSIEGTPVSSNTDNINNDDSKQTTETESLAQEDVVENSDDENSDDDDDGSEDDDLIHKYVDTGAGISPQDEEMLKEVMSQYDVSALELQDKDTEMETENISDEESPIESATDRENEPAMMERNSEEANSNESEDEDDDGYADNNGQRVDDFMAHLGDNITVDDRESILEAISEFGAVTLEARDIVQNSMDVADTASEAAEHLDSISNQENFLQSSEGNKDNSDATEANSDSLLTEEETEQTDDEPEGTDFEREFPRFSKFLTVDDQQTLTDLMTSFDVLEANPETKYDNQDILASIPLSATKESNEVVDEEKKDILETTEEESGFVDMENPKDSDEDDEDDDEDSMEDPVDEILEKEKDAIFKPDGLNPEDRSLLSELVSRYDVSVMVEKEQDQEMSVKDRNVPEIESDFEETQKQLPAPEYDSSKTSVKNDLLSPRCTLPAEIGPCRGKKLKWYFDMETGKCSTFFYGGCQGNGNRFDSRRKCMKNCIGNERSGIFRKLFPSPTKRITIMMPFPSLLPNMEAKPQMPRLPPKVAIPDIVRSMEDSRMPLPLLPEERFSVNERFNVNPRLLEQPRFDDGKMGVMPPLVPLHFLLLRALLKHQPNEFRGNMPAAPPSPPPPPPAKQAHSNGLPMINMPPPSPGFQYQEPVPRLSRQQFEDRPNPFEDMRHLSRFDENIRAPEDERRQHQFDYDRGHNIFAPSLNKRTKFKSSKHDNRHFNNVTPNNKFTLLQVFMNKPHQNMPGSPPQKLITPPSGHHTQPEIPLNSYPVPNTNSRPSAMHPFHPHFTPPHMHPMPMWHPFMPPQPPFPFNGPFLPHAHPFQPSYRMGRNEYLRRSGPPRRDEDMPPLIVVTDPEDEEEGEDHYACLLPLATGKCKSFQTKWYFNRDTQKCEIFYFTGCGGNANNFETWEECAATCIDAPSGPKTTVPRKAEETSPSVDTVEEEKTGDSPDILYITSTVFPETEEEAQQAEEEAAAGGQEAPSIEELRSTTEKPEFDEEIVQEAFEDSLEGDNESVELETTRLSTEYIILMAVLGSVGLAVIVLVSISIVHLYKKMNTSKKEKALEAVINHHLYGDLPTLVHTGKSPVNQNVNNTSTA